MVWEQIASKWENAPICLPCQVFCTWPSCHLSLTSRRAQLTITKFKEAIGKTDFRLTEEMGRWAQPTFKHKCATWVTEKNSSHVVENDFNTNTNTCYCSILCHWISLNAAHWAKLVWVYSSLIELYVYAQNLVKLRVPLFYTNIKSPLTDHDSFVSPQHLDEKSPAPPSQSNSHMYWLKSYLLGCNGLCYIIISHKTKRFPSHDRCRITGFYITLTVFMR